MPTAIDAINSSPPLFKAKLQEWGRTGGADTQPTAAQTAVAAIYEAVAAAAKQTGTTSYTAIGHTASDLPSICALLRMKFPDVRITSDAGAGSVTVDWC